MNKGITRLVYLNAFTIGFVIMGFEMVASRYMYPFFGGGITTWAALISTVLLALMTGYFIGGALTERFHSLSIMGGIIIAAAFYMALVPLATQSAFEWLSHLIANDMGVLLVSAMVLLFIPIALFGTFTPYSIHMVLSSAAESGKIAGRIYGISTFGNVIGTLATTFYLIPHVGSTALTFLFAGLTFMSGMLLFIFSYFEKDT